MKPRGRDVAAILLTLLLVRIAFLDRSGPESLIVDVNLAFYNELTTTATLVPATTTAAGGGGSNEGGDDDPDRPGTPLVKTASPVTLDVDGDGIAEAIVVPFASGTTSTGPDGGVTTVPRWSLRVLDLKPLHATSGVPGTGGLPFRPAAMFASKPESPFAAAADESKDDGDAKDRGRDAKSSPSSSSLPAVPVKMVSGQLVLHPSHPYAKLKALEAESKESSTSGGGSSADSEERSRHYYCGVDWHDAAASCHKHCPSGTSSECPDGMQCYADTPCDSLRSADRGGDDADDSLNATKLALTPRGSIPSVVTVWSDGAVSLHGITGDVVSDVQIPPAGHGKKGGGRHHKVHKPHVDLEFRELWRVRPFQRTFWDRGDDRVKVDDDKVWLDFEEVDVALLGPEAPIGQYGAVIVAGTYELRSMQEGIESEDLAAVVALDASSGTKIWSTDDERFAEHDGTIDERKLGSGRTSRARRRSGIVAPQERGGRHAAGGGAEAMMAGDCLKQFRHSVLDPSVGALPHSYWGPGSTHHAAVVVTHFDRRRRHSPAPAAAAGASKRHRGKRDKEPQKKPPSHHRKWQQIMLENVNPAPKLLQPGKPEKSQVPAKARHATASHDPTKHHHHAHHHNHHHKRSMSEKHSGKEGGGLTYGRPNVVLAHNMWGITALSLRNGKPVCHLSLLDHGLYGDFNGDGVVDVVQVVTQANADSSEALESEFVKDLLKRIKTEGDETKTYGAKKRPATVPNFPCHALALSGLPAREQLFDAELCGGGGGGGARADALRRGAAASISPAPPLLVEGSSSPNSNDIVFATSNGVVTRLDPSGHRIWKTSGGGGDAAADLLPTWDSDGDGTPEPAASLGRIDFSKSYVSFGSSGDSDTAAAPGPVRPIVLTGGDGAAILSAGRGRILAATPFPQHSLRHPIYGDLNGDGTTDFMVVSADAVWGYTVFVTTGGANFLRIAVGLLLFGMALAVLRNRFGNPEGVDKRSTDA